MQLCKGKLRSRSRGPRSTQISRAVAGRARNAVEVGFVHNALWYVQVVVALEERVVFTPWLVLYKVVLRLSRAAMTQGRVDGGLLGLLESEG
jgi:hypothetical protein